MRKLYPIVALAGLLIGLSGCKKEPVLTPAAEMFARDMSSRARVGDDVLLATNTDTTGNYYNSLGVDYALKGQYELALHYLQQAMTARTGAGVVHKIAKLHNNIANVYRAKGDFVNASLHFQKALAIIRTQENEKAWQAHIRRNYGLAYQDHGDYEEAKKMYRKALAYWKSVGNGEQIAKLEIDLQVINHLSSATLARFSGNPAQGNGTYER
jgi:tetratricopeptide (TPR) repeat protein